MNNIFAGYTDTQGYLSLVPANATHIKLGNNFYSVRDSKLVDSTNRTVRMGDIEGNTFDVGKLN